VPRKAELSDEENVERRIERTRNLVGNRDAAARQREDDDIIATAILLEALRQLNTGFATVLEDLRRVEVPSHVSSLR
jgi:hypothetical protein